MLISRLIKSNKKVFYTNVGYQNYKFNKLIASFYSNISDLAFERIENYNSPYKMNKLDILTIRNKNFQRIERIILELDNYNCKSLDEKFYLHLISFYKNLIFFSKNNCRKIPNLDLTLEKIRKKIFKIIYQNNYFNNLNEVKGILFFIYVLEKKRIYSINREENNSILPKILKYLENNHEKLQLAEMLEIIQVMVHFGITFNLKLIENKFSNQINKVSFDDMNFVIKNILDHKNNKLNYYKTILTTMLLPNYITKGLEGNLNNKLSLLANLTNLYLELPGLNAYNHICRIVMDIKKEFLLDDLVYEKMESNSVLNLFQGIKNITDIKHERLHDNNLDILLKSGDFVKIVSRIYDHVADNMIENSTNNKLTSFAGKEIFNKNRKFNLPLFLLFIKQASFIQSNLLPKEEHIKKFIKFIKNNLIVTQIIHREALFCFKLMEVSSFNDPEFDEILRKYLIQDIHFLCVGKYPIKSFAENFRTLYKNDENKFNDNIIKPITKNFFSIIENTKKQMKDFFLFKLFVNMSLIIESEDIFNKYSNFVNSLGEIHTEEGVKDCFKILEYYATNQEYLSEKFSDILNQKLINVLHENKERYIILDLTSTKIMIYLDSLKLKFNSNSFYLRENLINFIIDFKNKRDNAFKFKILSEFRMLAENNISIHHKTIIRIANLLKAEKLELGEEHIENLVKFIYIFLFKSRSSDQDIINLNRSSIEDLLLHINIKKIDTNCSKINILNTLEILSEIINNDKGFMKLNQIYDQITLLKLEQTINH